MLPVQVSRDYKDRRVKRKGYHYSKRDLQGVFADSMPHLHEMFYVFEGLLKHHLPKAHKALEERSLPPALYACNWFMTLFAWILPFGCSVRVIDVFAAEGEKVLYRVALALMEYAFSGKAIPPKPKAKVWKRVKKRHKLSQWPYPPGNDWYCQYYRQWVSQSSGTVETPLNGSGSPTPSATPATPATPAKPMPRPDCSAMPYEELFMFLQRLPAVIENPDWLLDRAFAINISIEEIDGLERQYKAENKAKEVAREKRERERERERDN
ncbi:hypothetical protein KIPB_010687 [Kipferlia bialata]|uniref:Rab-GAP TBC domain-containing protein n=1 Tax=Kipferlia bialata TaxID=797122 RepID=A0A9K3GLR4_9EUKA|nr:hypothetical protein KIPB_010687 [Kipferlia bialata]|eukprot:g10687.t1